jgi:cytochrome c oxidase cbb3-type subunit 3
MYRQICLLLLCASGFAADERGRSAYVASCGFCHGNDATGNRAPDLIRSPLVNHDQNGNLIGPVIKNGRPDKGMPGLPLPPQQIADIVAFLHFRVNEALHSAHVPGDYPLEKLLTGDAAQGKSYFEGAGGCAGCHSPTGDLAGIAKKYSPIDLQSRFLYPQGRRQMVQRTVTVKLPSGQQFEGRLLHLDEFDVAMRDANGVYHSWPRTGVEVTIHDPLAAHRALLEKYTDADVHNLFAYLETLK